MTESNNKFYTLDEVVGGIMTEEAPLNRLNFFFGYATAGIKGRSPFFKKYDAASSINRAMLTGLFDLAQTPAPVALSLKSGTVPRSSVANAFGKAAKASGMPVLERQWKKTCLRLGLTF